MIEWLWFLIIGAVAGSSAGLFGIGGGLLIVPALVLFYQGQGLDHDIIMHMAIATSLMTIVVTSLSSTYAHHKYRHIKWPLVLQLAPVLAVGSFLGAFFTILTPTVFLKYGVIAYMIISAIKLCLPQSKADHSVLLNKLYLYSFGMLTGIISAMVGIGGGSLVVPYLASANQSIKQAIGVAAACGFPIAAAAATSFIMFSGHHASTSNLAEQSGLIDWNAFIGISISSVIFARLGAKLAKQLSVSLLRRVFALLLIIVALEMGLGIQ